MNATFESLKTELTLLATAVSAIGNNEPLNIAHGNWSFAGVTRDELARHATEATQLIDSFAGNEAPPNEKLLSDYVRRLAFLRANTVPQIWSGNAGPAVQAYETTLATLVRALREAFLLDFPPSKDEQLKALRDLKALQNSIRSIEVRVTAASSRAGSLDGQITAIERAHQAAEQLPTDLETLSESRSQLATLLEGARADREEMTKALNALNEANAKLQKSNAEAAAVLSRCDAAYRSSTSQGLASAFAERSQGLSISMWVWVAGLIAALALGAYFGSEQLHRVVNLANESAQSGRSTELWINILLAIFSVAGPVWFAWLATKQVGQRFRLAEDYGYKASISKAYEGYRREAALLEPTFQARLFSSALTRLEELPLRLVEAESHGSPWHELLSSPTVQKALESIPDFADKVKVLAGSLVAAASVAKPAVIADAQMVGQPKQ